MPNEEPQRSHACRNRLLRIDWWKRYRGDRARQGAGRPRTSGPANQHGDAVPAAGVSRRARFPRGPDSRIPAVPGAAVSTVAGQQDRPGQPRAPARHHPRHYAIPHAAAAYLARQILANTPGTRCRTSSPRCNGTDVTLIGSDSSYSETAAFCIDQSDGVTAVSESLRADTYRRCRCAPTSGSFRIVSTADITVARRIRGCGPGSPVTTSRPCSIHVSNFRPVKRAQAVIDIFDRIHRRVPSRLLLVGDGPDLDRAGRRARELGLAAMVNQLGEQEQVVPLLSVADLFLLPSEQESFGAGGIGGDGVSGAGGRVPSRRPARGDR